MTNPRQFSLRTALALVVVVAVLLGMWRSTTIAIVVVVLLSLLHLNVMILISRRLDEVNDDYFGVVSFGWMMYFSMVIVGLTPVAFGWFGWALGLLWGTLGPPAFGWVVVRSRAVFVPQPDLRRPYLASCGAMFVCQGWIYYWTIAAFLNSISFG